MQKGWQLPDPLAVMLPTAMQPNRTQTMFGGAVRSLSEALRNRIAQKEAWLLRGGRWLRLEADRGVLAVLGIVVVLLHPLLELGAGLGRHAAIVRGVGEVLDLGLQVAGEVGSTFAEDGQQDNQLLVRLLPLGWVGLVAEGGLEFLGAIEVEVHTTNIAVGEEIGAAFALRLVNGMKMVEVGFAAGEDVDAEGIVGGIFALSVEQRWGQEERKAKGSGEAIHERLLGDSVPAGVLGFEDHS